MSKRLKILATDLDRTLLPNGLQPYEGSMPMFKNLRAKAGFKLIYVTGRDVKLVKSAIKRFGAPLPDYLVTEVGTRIYFRKDKTLKEDAGWKKFIAARARNWSILKFKKNFFPLKNLRLQEKSKQGRFKLSYYVRRQAGAKKMLEQVALILKNLGAKTEIIYSVDETKNLGLLDILPKHFEKTDGLEYLRKKLRVKKDAMAYCGDSGNDIGPLTFGYKSILVKNAAPEIKRLLGKTARKNQQTKNLYIAAGRYGLNGYYVSGIIEGLIHFKAVSPKEVILKRKK